MIAADVTLAGLVEFALLGLGAGGVFAMLGQGIVLIYRGSGIVNFAHGAMAMAGGFLFWDLRWTDAREEQMAFLPAFIIAVGTMALIGALTHLLVMKPLGKSSPLVRVIASLALLTVLTGASNLYWGGELTILTRDQSPLPVKTWAWGDINVQSDRVYLLIVATAITAVLWAVFRFSRFGLAVVASAEDELSASALGWSPDLLATVNWAVGGALAGLAGVLVAPITGLEMNKATLMVIAALAAALLANFSNFWIALAGGVGIGMFQSLTVYFASKSVPVLEQPGVADAFPFILIIIVLVVRGRALPLRSHLLETLPTLGSGRMPWWILGFPVVLAVLSLTVFNEEWNLAFFTSYAAAIVLLSVIVLTGYAGQISLAQYALAGIGALAAGKLVEKQELPFVVALVIGVVITMLVGLVFALPALRTRGINLAVTTLGLGLAVQALVFSNGKYTGDISGVRVGETSFLGIDVYRLNHPGRYAVLTLFFLVLASAVVLNIRRGRAGRRLIAIRTNERAAASLGVSALGAKLYAFVLSAGIAGLGGILLGFKDPSILFDSHYNPFASINAVTLAVLGGIGYVLGPVMGSTLAMGGIGALISTRIGVDDDWIVLIGGLILLVQLILVPSGMASHPSKALQKATLKRFERNERELDGVDFAVEQPEKVPPMVLDVSDVTVRLGSVYAVFEAGLDVHPGEVVGLIGPNGAGKTTFIDAITGFVKPTKGEVRLDGTDLVRWPAARRKRAGISRTWQSLELFEDLSVRDNLLAAADDGSLRPYLVDPVWPRKEHLPAAAVRAIKDFDLDSLLDTHVSDLSYGQRRLVSIARALAGTPSILLLDEPAAGLSDAETAELSGLIRQLVESWGIGVLLVEHDMNLVMAVCDRIVALETGKIIATGTPDEIAQDDRVRAAYLGDDVPTPVEPQGGDVSDLEPSLDASSH